jgi:hypothetical protein
MRILGLRLSIPTALFLLLLPSQGETDARAEDFRVENKVFLEGEREPGMQSTTIFHEGVVYDYLKAPAEVVVFDKGRNRILLLDLSRRVLTELTTDEVSGLNKGLKEWALSQGDPFLRFLANPQLEEAFNEQAAELVLSSSWLTYRVVLANPGSGEIARQYREFSDWSTLLNTRLNPGSKLPFARLLVNQSVEKRQQLPKEVHLTTRSKKGKKVTARSEHQLVRTLVQSDRDRIRQTDEYLAMFRRVGFAEYRKAAP